MPSVTLPNWKSHLTGSGPEEHGIVNNSWTIDKHELMPLDTDAEGYYPSIFKLLKEQVPNIKTGKPTCSNLTIGCLQKQKGLYFSCV